MSIGSFQDVSISSFIKFKRDRETARLSDFGGRGQELGGGKFKTGEVSGKEYISLTFAHSIIGPRKVYANLGQAYGKEADEFAIVWSHCPNIRGHLKVKISY